MRPTNPTGLVGLAGSALVGVVAALLASCGAGHAADAPDPVVATRERLQILGRQAEVGAHADGSLTPSDAWLREADCVDAWGHAIVLRWVAGELDLVSSGTDGAPGTADDIAVRADRPATGGATGTDPTALPTLIPVEAKAATRIDSVLREMDRNYGGTLVCDPADPALDSAAFVQRYLRRFARTPAGHDADYRFERLLARLAGFPAPLEDARLDADLWAAYRAYEVITGGASTYRDGNTIQSLNSARDLLWTFLGVQAQRIRADATRRAWWLDRLSVDAGLPRERLARTFALLQLISAAQGDGGSPGPIRVTPETKPPAAAAGLTWFAGQLGLGWQTWGVDPATLPAPRIDQVNVSGRMSSIEFGLIVDQESWSSARQFFTASYWTPVGRRAGYANVRIPLEPSADGLFFFVTAKTLQIWPKARMADAGPRMLQVAGFLDAPGYTALVERMGAHVLDATGVGAAPDSAVPVPAP